MTALIVILSIILLLVLLLICPLKVYFEYTDSPHLTLKYLFLSFKILPQTKKQKKKPQNKQKSDKKPPQKKEEKKEKKPSFIKKIIDKKGLKGFLYIVKEVASFAVGELKSLFSHVVIEDLSVDVSVACDDAAETAVTYGKVCAVIYPALSVIAEHTKCKKYHADVKTNFKKNAETEIDALAVAKISLFWLIKTVLGAIIKGSKLYVKLNTNI